MRNKKNETAKYRRDKKKKKACEEAKNPYHEAKKNHLHLHIDDRYDFNSKANQDEEKGDGSTQTQEEEGKAAWVEAPWHKCANIKSRDKYKDCGAEFKGSYTRWKQHVLPSV